MIVSHHPFVEVQDQGPGEEKGGQDKESEANRNSAFLLDRVIFCTSFSRSASFRWGLFPRTLDSSFSLPKYGQPGRRGVFADYFPQRLPGSHLPPVRGSGEEGTARRIRWTAGFPRQGTVFSACTPILTVR